MFSFLSLFQKKKTVMILDDDEITLKVYGKMLQKQDEYDVILASNKDEFMKNIDKVDAVLSDYHMKENIGLTFNYVLNVCDQMKIPLTLISGDIFPYYDYQLQKPISVNSLRDGIDNMFKRGYKLSKKRPPKEKVTRTA
jgi:DNA-binding NtrC family response regulator